MKRKRTLDDTQPIVRNRAPKSGKSTTLGWFIVIAFFGCIGLFVMSSSDNIPRTSQTGSGTVYRNRATAVPTCIMSTSSDRGRFDLQLIISGKKQENVFVDIKYKSRTLPVEKRYRKSFSDTGDPYILQYYSTYDLEAGAYTISWKLGGHTNERRLSLAEADWRLDLYCG